jgi:3-hydroxy-9,10-secoandrosta-1,3,5(10)-triene-9,17-dione monooxygenase reductase component
MSGPLEFSVEVDQSQLRSVMARYITGVSVVTTTRHGELLGVTVSSFTSVTLEPPTVLVCLRSEARTTPAIIEADCYAINVLSGSQAAVARRFASPDLTQPERFRWLELNYAITGCPLLAGAAAWLDCRLRQTFRIGTHDVLVGDVLAAGTDPTGEAPLMYHDREMAPLR